SIVGWYVTSFVVKPNELVRESPYIAHNIEMTRQAFALNRIEQIPFPAEAGVAPGDGANNSETLPKIRLSGWRAAPGTRRRALGLARAAGHAASDSGNPDLLRLPRHRYRSLSGQRRRAADDAGRP